MTKTALVDTNILTYAYDRHNTDRQQRAKQLLVEIYTAGIGYLSAKTLSEFFVSIRRLPGGLKTSDALREMEKFGASWTVLDLTSEIAIEAARGVQRHQMSYWDAQMWATVKLHQIDGLFTVDMNTGAVFDGIEIVNPLADTFDLQKWLQR